MNVFSKHDLRVTIEEGQPALLACHAPDSYPDRNIYWSKVKDRGHFPVQQDTTSHFSTSLSGDLYFSYTTRSDEGVYYCSVENSKLRRFERRTVSLNVNRSKLIIYIKHYLDFLLGISSGLEGSHIYIQTST